MNRYRIEPDASLDPPFCLIPDPLGVVVLAEAALTEIREAEEVGRKAGVIEGRKNISPQAFKKNADLAVANALNLVDDWLREQGRPKTADALREAMKERLPS